MTHALDRTAIGMGVWISGPQHPSVGGRERRNTAFAETQPSVELNLSI
jgi:hypothetical protein